MTPLTIALPAPALAAAEHSRAERKHAFEVEMPPAAAFTLFEPLGEKNWAKDWQPVFASTADARLDDGSIFTVARPSTPGAPAVTSVWTIVRYEPPRLIEYHNVIFGVRATRIRVQCESAGDRRTHVTVRYVYTGLSTEGDEAIQRMDEATFSRMIDDWGAAIADYLQRGTPASP